METKQHNSNNVYAQLFAAKVAPLSPEAQAEFDRITAKCESDVSAMTDEEKSVEFDRIMGR